MRKIIPAIIMGLLSLPSLAAATEPFDFINDVINSLEAAEIAKERMEVGQGSSDTQLFMKDLMVFNNGIAEAAIFIGPYLSSKNKIIKEASSSIHETYLMAIENNLKLIGMIKDAFNNIENTVSNQGSFFRKFSERMAANEEIWRILPDSIILAQFCLVDARKAEEDGTLKSLTITANERKSMITKLENVYGKQIMTGLKVGLHPVEISGYLLYEVLNKAWQSASGIE